MEAGQVLPRMQAVNISTQQLHFGDNIQNIYNGTIPVDVDELAFQLRARLKKKNNMRFGTWKGDSIPLIIVKETQQKEEQFGFRDLKQQIFTNLKVKMLKADELFARAHEQAKHEATELDYSDDKSEDYILRCGNVVAVIGTAGVGKTTLAVQFLKHISETSGDSEVYLFFVAMKDFNFDKPITILQFLLRSSINDFPHDCEEKAKAMLDRLANSVVYIFIDGLDEAKIDLEDEAHVMEFYEAETPGVILKNLLRGDVLGNAFKWLGSRPGAYYKLCEDCKPRFTARVIGLSEESQKMLCRKICNDTSIVQQVQSNLDMVPAVKTLCSIPMFCKVMIPYTVKQIKAKSKVVSVTGAFASVFDDCARSKQLRGKKNCLKALAELALNGILNDTFVFDAEDLEEHLDDFKAVEVFISVSVVGTHICIVEGDKRYFFSHLTFQEFFAAVYLIYVADVEQLRGLLLRFKEDRWEVVVRFLFGLCNDVVYKQLVCHFGKKTDIETKREVLADFACSYAREYAKDSDKDFPLDLEKMYATFSLRIKHKFPRQAPDLRLLKLCSWAQEYNNERFRRKFGDHLPDVVLLRDNVSQCDVASLEYAISAVTDRSIVINAGVLYTYIYVEENTLACLVDMVSRTNHKIAKLYLASSALGVSDRIAVEKVFQGLEEFAVFYCAHEAEFGNHLAGWLDSRQTPLRYLGMGNDVLSCEQMSECVGKAERIEFHSPFEYRDMQVLVDKMQDLARPVKWLDIGDCDMETRTAALFHRCIDKVEMLWIHNSSVVLRDDFLPFVDALCSRKTPLERLNFGRNHVVPGREALLGRLCLNVKRFKADNLKLNLAGMQAICNAVNSKQEPMLELDISQNPLSVEMMSCLCTCLHNIEILIIADCSLIPDVFRVFCEAVARLKLPLKGLVIRDNPLGDEGARMLTSCLRNVTIVWLEKCGFSKAGRDWVDDAQKDEANVGCVVMDLEEQ